MNLAKILIAKKYFVNAFEAHQQGPKGREDFMAHDRNKDSQSGTGSPRNNPNDKSAMSGSGSSENRPDKRSEQGSGSQTDGSTYGDENLDEGLDTSRRGSEGSAPDSSNTGNRGNTGTTGNSGGGR